MSVDVMDALGTPIEVHVRGPEILRILPRIFPELNEEWLADKGRQAFDGLKYQRLNTILKRLPDGRLKELTWSEGLQEAVTAIKRVQPEEIQARIGSFADVEAIVSLRDLMHRIGAEKIIYTGKNELNHDFRAQYLMGSMIKSLNYVDTLLMVGFNMRTTSPVLNARIRRAVTEKKMKVAVIGPGERLLYQYLHLGNSTKTLNDIANKSHPFSKVLENSKLPMIIVSSDILRRKDGKEIERILYKLCCDYKVINTETKWNGYNVILKSAAEAGAYDIGLTSNLSEEEMKRPIKLVYLLNADDNLEDIPSDAYVIYQGFHGEVGAARADLIFPSAAYTEKNGTYVNTEGRAQYACKTIIPPGEGKPDWEILRALSEELGCTLPYDNLEEVRARIAELAPSIIRVDSLETIAFEDIITKYGAQKAQELKPGILADSIDVSFDYS